MEPGMDCEFVDLIDQITANIRRLNSSEEAQLVDIWVTRLSEENDKVLRNEYCKQLNKLIRCGKLRYPFSKTPPSGRLPLYKDIVNPKFNPLAPCRRLRFDTSRNTEHWIEPSQPFYENPTRDDKCTDPGLAECPDYRNTLNVQEQCPPCPPFCEPIDKCVDQQVPKRKSMYKADECNTDTYKEQVDKLIDAICPTTLLEEFASQVGRFTCDNGKIMFNTISRETNDFRDLVRSIYESRNSDISETLNQEQKRVKDNFEKLEGRLLAKTQEGMNQIKNAIPEFSWEDFAADKKYIWNNLYPKMKSEFQKCTKQDNEYRQVGVKRKTWLKEIARQLQEDNGERRAELTQLSKLLTSLTISYACSQNKLTEHIGLMECEANSLKTRIIENQKIIENMLSKIQTLQKN